MVHAIECGSSCHSNRSKTQTMEWKKTETSLSFKTEMPMPMLNCVRTATSITYIYVCVQRICQYVNDLSHNNIIIIIIANSNDIIFIIIIIICGTANIRFDNYINIICITI